MGSDLNVTVGALLLGVLVTAVGFGITTMQTYLYMNRFPNDPWITRWMVWSLLILDTMHVTLSWHTIYHYLILNFNNPPALEDSVWSFNLTIVLTAVITVIVHCFYAKRVHILSGGVWPITVFILALSLLRFVFGVIVCVKFFIIQNLQLLPLKISAEVGVGLGAGTLADCVITVSLVYCLRKHKSGFNPLDNLLDRIAYWTVNNGMLTSIVGIVVIVMFSAMPDNMINFAVHLLLSKLYANSLLATLNFRASHRGRGFDTDNSTIPMPVISAGGARRVGSVMSFCTPKDSQAMTSTPSTTTRGARSPPIVHVVTTTTTEQETDACIGRLESRADKDGEGYKRPDYDFALGADV